MHCIFFAGQALQWLLKAFPHKVDDQDAMAKKMEMIYSALEAHLDVYYILPNRSFKSMVKICFRVIKGDSMGKSEKAFLKESTALGSMDLKSH